MDYAVTAREILEKVGGASNVAGANHCMTRLRLTLKDQSLVDDSQVKAIKGVVGVMKKAGQYQIIIGNEVAKCYKELCKLGNFGDGGGSTLAPSSCSPSSATRPSTSCPYWWPTPPGGSSAPTRCWLPRLWPSSSTPTLSL